MDLQKALRTINDAVVQGNLDDISLEKANTTYKDSIGFEPSLDYNILKSQSLNDKLRGIEFNQDLIKALMEGETKIGSDGKKYILVRVPSGKLDWRIFKDKNNTVDNKLNDVFENDDFPKSSKEFKILNTSVGGSTGAKMVEDKNGKKFIMKKGASKGHVEEEFLTNAIYKTAGFDTPEMKIYQEGNDTFILSEFIANTKPFDSLIGKDVLAMDAAAEGFAMDCLMANWDAYKNDNILVDSNGIPIRVDNGGSLRYRAQGGLKTNFSSNVDELTSMITQNQWISKHLTQDKINSQISDILTKEKEILGLVDDPILKSILKARMVYMKNRLPVDNTKKPAKKVSNKKMYRELTEDELQVCYDNVNGKLHSVGANGWEFLSQICKLRGFDAVPEVLDDSEFNKQLNDPNSIYVNRGIADGGGVPALKFMKDFTENPDCFYGSVGIHGAGIYAGVNVAKQNTRKDHGYNTALAYAYGNPQHILDIVIPKSAKITTKKKIKEMMDEEFFGPEFKTKKQEFDKTEKEYLQLKTDLSNEKKKIEDDTKKNLGWNQKALDYLIYDRPEIALADTTKNSVPTVINTVEKLIQDLNGGFKQVDDHTYEIQLPNSNAKFLLNVDDFDNALKQKNETSPVYNFRLQRLKNFIIEQHYNRIKNVIDDKVSDALRNSPSLKQMSQDIDSKKKDLDVIQSEVSKLKKGGGSPSNKIIGHILKQGSAEMYGIYAAIHGYDAMIAEGGNDEGCDYAIILNRSITKVKKF